MLHNFFDISFDFLIRIFLWAIKRSSINFMTFFIVNFISICLWVMNGDLWTGKIMHIGKWKIIKLLWMRSSKNYANHTIIMIWFLSNFSSTYPGTNQNYQVVWHHLWSSSKHTSESYVIKLCFYSIEYRPLQSIGIP